MCTYCVRQAKKIKLLWNICCCTGAAWSTWTGHAVNPTTVELQTYRKTAPFSILEVINGMTSPALRNSTLFVKWEEVSKEPYVQLKVLKSDYSFGRLRYSSCYSLKPGSHMQLQYLWNNRLFSPTAVPGILGISTKKRRSTGRDCIPFVGVLRAFLPGVGSYSSI